jgi:hypothetical protein
MLTCGRLCFWETQADGRTLSVFANPAGTSYNPPAATADNRRAPAQLIDGTRGFAEGDDRALDRATYEEDSNDRLYSDSMVAPVQRGRGFLGDWTRRGNR